MVRYQSSENSQNRQVIETTLKSKTKSKLGIDTKLKVKTKIKQKLKVYRSDGKFYIDQSAAYALKLTTVKSVMQEKPKRMEISLGTLLKFQYDENIELEYHELDKEKTKVEESNLQESNLQEVLEGLDSGEYGIGVHRIDKGSLDVQRKTATSISEKGLNLNNNNATILSTAVSLGTMENVSSMLPAIKKNYLNHDTEGVSVVIAAPLYIQNESGETIFLGFPEQNTKTSSQQHESHCILDRICAKMEKIPPQFILGYYVDNPDGTQTFFSNSSHYSQIDSKGKEELFNEMEENMDDLLSKTYNKLIAEGNIAELRKSPETPFFDNALNLAIRYKRKGPFKSVGEKSAEKSENEKSNANQRTRRILLNTEPTRSNYDGPTSKRRIASNIEKKTDGSIRESGIRSTRHVLHRISPENKLNKDNIQHLIKNKKVALEFDNAESVVMEAITNQMTLDEKHKDEENRNFQ